MSMMMIMNLCPIFIRQGAKYATYSSDDVIHLFRFEKASELSNLEIDGQTENNKNEESPDLYLSQSVISISLGLMLIFNKHSILLGDADKLFLQGS